MGIRDGDGVFSQRLRQASGLSLDWCVQVMGMKLPSQDSEAFASVVRAKTHTSQTVLTLLARTNEMQLKQQALGKLPELLKIIQDEEQKMKLITSTIV